MDEIREQFLKKLEKAISLKEVEDLRVRYLGRKGTITTLSKNTDFKQMAPDQRKEFGTKLNELKALAEAELARKAEAAKARAVAGTPAARLDLTLPGAGHAMGCIHPIALVQMELEEIFQGMGFMVLTGYEVETEYFNFDALNIPGDHPARDMQDTYWLTSGRLMRTHTSANQVRALERFGRRWRRSFPAAAFVMRPSTPAMRTRSTNSRA